tara:strand:+ start:172 stop:906 length:735 start_codon:yes stop_codon:yes gene_type:complete
MVSNVTKSNLNKLIEEFNFKSDKKYKLIILLGLLGDFDSFEYAINLKNYFKSNQNKNLDIFAIAIGNENGKAKFCNFTGFPIENIEVVSDNSIHNDYLVSKGLDIGLGGWINMLLMLSGINSFKTILEVLRGYTGDRNAKQIFSDLDKIELLNLIKFSGNSFSNAFGEGYLRPFELATFRLNNMIEILKNWNDYISNDKFLPQRSASFIMNNNNEIIYKFFSKDVLGYSPNMKEPLKFINDICE